MKASLPFAMIGSEGYLAQIVEEGSISGRSLVSEAPFYGCIGISHINTVIDGSHRIPDISFMSHGNRGSCCDVLDPAAAFATV
jgi:hypothetical protein